jgi:hypothetical protein
MTREKGVQVTRLPAARMGVVSLVLLASWAGVRRPSSPVL